MDIMTDSSESLPSPDSTVHSECLRDDLDDLEDLLELGRPTGSNKEDLLGDLSASAVSLESRVSLDAALLSRLSVSC